MPKNAIVPDRSELASLRPYVESARRFASRSRAEATRDAYESQWRSFEEWCRRAKFVPLPAAPATLAVYVAFRAEHGASRSTIAQSLAAIDFRHLRARVPSPRRSPEVEETWAGIRRELQKPQRGASALRPEHLKKMVLACGEGLACARDRAVLVVGFSGAFRRSELVALLVEDVEETKDGLVVHIRKSKTDQEGKGETVGLPFGSDRWTCPVRSVREWLEVSGLKEGALFRSVGRGGKLGGAFEDGRAVARILKRAAKRAHVELPYLSGHSLRAGLVTASARAGKSVQAIMAQTRHKSVQTVYRYIRRTGADLFNDNAASGIGL